MAIFKGFASLVLALATVSALSAETSCPGNVAGVPLQVVNSYKIIHILAVSVNHSGPYGFLLDTGAQKTIVDSTLAAELHLRTQDTATVADVGYHAAASLAQVEQLQAGPHAVTNQMVLVYDLQELNSTGIRIQGILGEDFLGRFDMLIDNAHSMLCLDDSATMRTNVKGPHISLLTPTPTADGIQLTNSLIVVARLSDGRRPVRLNLDSGANVPALWNVRQFMDLGIFPVAALSLANGVDGAQQAFSALPRQEVKIGSLDLSGVLFIARRDAETNPHVAVFDGLLPAGLFRRVFIDHVNHLAILEQW